MSSPVRRHKDYTVIWEIDITAKSPRDAARQALEIQRDPDSLATVFDCWAEGKGVRVDLDAGTVVKIN